MLGLRRQSSLRWRLLVPWWGRRNGRALSTAAKEVATLRAENERMHERIKALQAQLAALEAQRRSPGGRVAHDDSADDKCSGRNPFTGLRVLDMSRVLAGPYCTMHLGDLGAEVIKIEHVKDGDETRSWGPPFTSGESSYFLGVNRSKKSVALDFQRPEGRRALRRLAAESDVLIQNFLPGTLEKHGLGYDDLQKLNPRLIYVTLTGYGPSGPDAHRPGYDVIVSARGGLMGITGSEGGPPCKVGVAVTDLCTGLQAFAAILGALWARERGGPGAPGQRVDCSLLETQVSMLANIGSAYLVAGWEGGRHGTAHPSIVPYQAVPTRDGYLVFGATNNAAFERFCRALGLEDTLLRDDRFLDNAARVANREALIEIITDVFAEHATADLATLLDDAGVVNSPINTISQVFQDPQVLERGMVQEVDHPTAGRIRLTGPAVKYSRTPARIRSAPPLLGQHSTEVLRDVLGMGADEIRELADAGVIRCASE